MKFIHVTDLHLVAESEMLWGLKPIETLDACLADIAMHHSDAAFVAITGDLAERGEVVAYELLKQRLSQLNLAVLLMLGWQVAGYYGADRFILPLIGAPWRPGKVFRRGGRNFGRGSALCRGGLDDLVRGGEVRGREAGIVDRRHRGRQGADV